MKIGVVGAGVMGSGIAQAFAQCEDFEVFLTDISKELAQTGKEKISQILEKKVSKGRLTNEEKQKILNRIYAAEQTELSDCDLVVEAAVENMEIKQRTFAKLDQICKKECIFATNTSSLSVTEIGNGLSRCVMGMHFFNPAPAMKLVEVISGMNSSEEELRRIKEIAEKMGKTPVEVKESAGFVVNRILIPMINEAVGIYAEGIASAADIDCAMKLGANHPIGPLALGDLIGLDVVLAIMEVLQKETGDSKYRPHPYLRKMVRAKKLGRKTGQGFFSY